MSVNYPHKTIHYRRVVDLSHPIHPHMPLWTGDPPVEFEAIAQIPSDGYYLRRFSMGEHSGTHMNAPNSFFTNGVGIDAYAAESLIAPAILMDVQAQAVTNPDYCLTISDILAWEQQHGTIPASHLVLLYTGWQAKWSDPPAFFNRDLDGQYHFPGFSGDATHFLLAERAIAGVGIDTHGVDPGWDSTFTTNQQVLAQNGIVLENLTNLDQLPATGTTLVIGILHLKNGSGSPASVLALVP